MSDYYILYNQVVYSSYSNTVFSINCCHIIYLLHNIYIIDRSLTMDGNLRTEPKHIVFLSQLLLLFRFCHSCKANNPLVATKTVGTKAVVTTTCGNPTCPQKTTTWHSQPLVSGTKISAGNLLLCMSILLGGGSISKVHQIFLHMGLGCVSLNSYFRYQKVCTNQMTVYKKFIHAMK